MCHFFLFVAKIFVSLCVLCCVTSPSLTKIPTRFSCPNKCLSIHNRKSVGKFLFKMDFLFEEASSVK